jgi:hypothetical protein
MNRKISVDIDALRRLWDDPAIYRCDIAGLLGISETTVRRLAEVHGLCRRKPYKKRQQQQMGPLPGDPTPDEIARLKAEIRRTWGIVA